VPDDLYMALQSVVDKFTLCDMKCLEIDDRDSYMPAIRAICGSGPATPASSITTVRSNFPPSLNGPAELFQSPAAASGASASEQHRGVMYMVVAPKVTVYVAEKKILRYRGAILELFGWDSTWMKRATYVDDGDGMISGWVYLDDFSVTPSKPLLRPADAPLITSFSAEPLITILNDNDFISLRRYVRACPDLNETNKLGIAPMHIALTLCLPECIVLLVKAGANPTLHNQDPMSKMHSIREFGYFATAQAQAAMQKKRETLALVHALRGLEDVNLEDLDGALHNLDAWLLPEAILLIKERANPKVARHVSSPLASKGKDDGIEPITSLLVTLDDEDGSCPASGCGLTSAPPAQTSVTSCSSEQSSAEGAPSL